MAGGDKEQITTQRFLAHDFEEPRWRTAALKNAYALLSKRRFSTLKSLQFHCPLVSNKQQNTQLPFSY
jgi:hypothetical protein